MRFEILFYVLVALVATVTHQAAAAVTVSSMVITEAAQTTLTITLSTDCNGSPNTGDFSVSIDGVASTVSNVAHTDGTSTVSLTIGTAPTFDQTVRVSYTKSGTAGEQLTSTTSADVLESFSNTQATNEIAMVPLEAKTPNTRANRVDIQFSGSIDTSRPDKSRFTYTCNSNQISVLAVQSSSGGSQLRLYIDRTVLKNDVCTIAYSPPTSGNKLKDDGNGYPVTSFTLSVTNEVSWEVTGMTPGNVPRDFATEITVTGSGFINGTTKIQLATTARKDASKPCITAGGGDPQLVTSVTEAKRSFTLEPNPGTQIDLCIAIDGDWFVKIDGTSLTLDVQLLTARVLISRANVLILTFTSAIGTVATKDDFEISASDLTVDSVAISSGDVELSLSRSVINGESFTVKYNAPSGDPKIKESESNWPLPSIDATNVNNLVTWTFDSPSVSNIGKAVSTSLTFTGSGWAASTSKIMIAKSSDCTAANGGSGKEIGADTTRVTTTFTIDENDSTTTSVCFSYNNDNYYVPIANSQITVQVPSVSNYGGRTRFAKNEITTLVIAGIGLNTNMGIKVISGTCDSVTQTFATVSFSSVNVEATSAQVQNLKITSDVGGAKICLNVHTDNGGSNDYGVDSGLSVDVVSVDSIDHTELGRNVITKVTLTGSEMSNDDSVKFVQDSSDCTQADIAGSNNDQKIQSTSFANMQLDQVFTNSLLCLKVGGTGSAGSLWTSTGVTVTIVVPYISSIDVNRYAKGESRTINFVGVGLTTDMKIMIRKNSDCTGTQVLGETALGNVGDDRKSASNTIQLNTAVFNAYVCEKVPSSQGGTDTFSYSSSTNFRMTVVDITGSSPSQAGKKVQFQFTTTHTSGAWSSDNIKIVKSGDCATGTLLGGGGEYQPSSVSSNFGREDLTLTEDVSDAKICLKVNHAGASYVDTGLTITVAKPTFTHISTDNYGSTQRRAYVEHLVLIYLQGYGLSSVTKLSLAANSDCTDELTGASPASITSQLADTTRAQVTFTVNKANPSAYVCETIPSDNGGGGAAVSVSVSSTPLRFDVAGNFLKVSISTPGAGFKVGTAATVPFQVSLLKRQSTDSSHGDFDSIGSVETDDDKHGVTSIAATFTQCTTRACFNHSTDDSVQVKCDGSENTDFWRRSATLSGKTSVGVHETISADYIRNGVATFSTAKVDYWGTGCKITFTVTTQGGYQEDQSMSKTVTSADFDVAGSAVKIVWKNKDLFVGGLATSTNVPVCTASYECDVAPIIEIHDASGSVITDNKLHGITNVQITVPDSASDTSCPSGPYSNAQRVYNNRRYTIENGVITYPKSNGASTPSYANAGTCYHNHAYTYYYGRCTSDSTHNLMFEYFGHDLKVRVVAERPANLAYHNLSSTMGAGYQLEHELTVKGKATHLELTMDTDNWVKGYGPTKTTAPGAYDNTNIKPERASPYVTVYEERANSGSKTRLTDGACVTGVVGVTASISVQHDESSTRGNAALASGTTYKSQTSNGHFIFKKIALNDYGRGFRLNFTCDVPTQKDLIVGDELQSDPFYVGILMYKRTLTVKEIDTSTNDYKSTYNERL